MRNLFLTAALVAGLGVCGAAQAQTSPPVGGSDAKGNAPLKHTHTVNDGSAKPGANSFTEGQARQHILNSGYTDVTGLAKGKDGVWRGMATHNGSPVQVAMDFKGNVTEATSGGGMGASMGGASSTTDSMAGSGAGGGAGMSGGSSDMSGSGASSGTGGGAHAHHARRRHHHHHHGACANPGPNGAACSGVSTMQSGVSDKESRAMQNGAHP